MKTYPFFYALWLLFFIGCSKSETPIQKDYNGGSEQKIKASYTVVTKNNGELTAKVLTSDSLSISIAEAESGFLSTAEPELVFQEDQTLTMYHKISGCSGRVTIHDFDGDSTINTDIFSDLGTCDLTVNAITRAGYRVYIAYSRRQNSKTDSYFLRLMDLADTNESVVDLELGFKPVEIVFANNRLFVLALDDVITDEHKLIVVDAEARNILFTGNLGYDVLGMFKNPEENIIVGYQGLHTTFDSQTLSSKFTNYPTNAEPQFNGVSFRHFDSSGKMYYARKSGLHSLYDRIPAVYDFKANSSVLYAYENFLTEAQLNFEFEIENTTVVRYDEANNLILIGYKKSGVSDKGGILRIKPVPEPAFAGNLNLDGIPYSIYIQ